MLFAAVHMSRQQRKIRLQKIRQRQSRHHTPGGDSSHDVVGGSRDFASDTVVAGALGAGDARHPYSRYRHLYQVRRSNGDVISQVRNVQLCKENI